MNGFAHSPNFAFVNWHDRLFTFTPMQRAVVRALWAARLYGTPFLDQATLVAEVADNNSDRPRMRDLFKRNSPFGTLIAKSRDMRGPQGRKLLAE